MPRLLKLVAAVTLAVIFCSGPGPRQVQAAPITPDEVRQALVKEPDIVLDVAREQADVLLEIMLHAAMVRNGAPMPENASQARSRTLEGQAAELHRVFKENPALLLDLLREHRAELLEILRQANAAQEAAQQP